MTDYQHVWGSVQKEWSRIDYRDSQLLTVLIVFAWVSMLGFFVFAAFSMLTRSDLAIIAMMTTLGGWLACGISIIRIRRGRQKFLKIQP